MTILENEEMPSVSEHAEIFIGSSSIIKRGPPSQLIEAACGMYARTHMKPSISYSTEAILASYVANFRVAKDVVNSILSRYEDRVVVSGIVPRMKVTKYDWMSFMSEVRANYGVIRVMQSCFLASVRMSSTFECTGAYSTSVNAKSSTGGSKSLGEMECTQLMASGMTKCIEEFIERSDMKLEARARSRSKARSRARSRARARLRARARTRARARARSRPRSRARARAR